MADLAVDGDLAYLATRQNGMRIVAVANPSHTREIGAFESDGILSDADLSSIAVSYPYAFLATAGSSDFDSRGVDGRVIVLDVKDPGAPVLVATLP